MMPASLSTVRNLPNNSNAIVKEVVFDTRKLGHHNQIGLGGYRQPPYGGRFRRELAGRVRLPALTEH
jgi:hypothetical protein